MHDVRPLGGEVTFDDGGRQLGVTVTPKTLGKSSCLSAEEAKEALISSFARDFSAKTQL